MVDCVNRDRQSFTEYKVNASRPLDAQLARLLFVGGLIEEVKESPRGISFFFFFLR